MPNALPIAVAVLLLAAFHAGFEALARRATRRADTDRAGAWFAAALGAQWTVLAFWAAWLAFAMSAPAVAMVRSVAAPDLAGAALIAAGLLPPLAAGAWAQWRLTALARDIRGAAAHPGHTLRRLLRPVLALVIAVGAFGLGPALVARGVPAAAVLLGAVAFAAVALAATRSPAPEEAPAAITAGELRDRIVAIAARAGVRVRQLYVLPQTPERVANAFAAQNQSVLITDYLLAHLGRDEVDAVMAHELAHLRRRDPHRLALGLIGVAACGVLGWFYGHSAATAALAFAAGMMAFLALSRRLEYGADRGAIALGARPEALITGLARLARLNDIPARWGRALEWTLTHPSLERRARAIARHAGLGEPEAAALLVTPGEPERPYDLPPALAQGGKVFSTRLKARRRMLAGWTLLVASVLAPALAGAAFAHLPRAASLVLATLAGLLVTPGAAILLSQFPYATVRRRLAERLARRGLGAHAQGARLVGLSPGSDARVIEGFYVWDAGFLKLTRGHLDYVGEETSFSLPAGQVQKLDLVSGPPFLLPTRCVRVTWLDEDGAWATLRLFALQPGPGSREARLLFEALDAWWRDALAARGHDGERLSFPRPRHHEVTSIAPAEQASPGAVVTATMLQTILALVVCGMLQRPLDPAAGPGWLDALVAGVAANLALLAPALRHREPARIERRSEAPGRAA